MIAKNNEQIKIPIDARTKNEAEILCQSIADAKNSGKFFKKGSAIIKDALKD